LGFSDEGYDLPPPDVQSTVAWMTRCGANRVGVEYCAHAKPIWFNDQTEKAVTPAPIKRQILENNETVRRLCH